MQGTSHCRQGECLGGCNAAEEAGGAARPPGSEEEAMLLNELDAMLLSELERQGDLPNQAERGRGCPGFPRLPPGDPRCPGCPSCPELHRLPQAATGLPRLPKLPKLPKRQSAQSSTPPIVDRINRFCAHGRGATPTAEPLSTDEASMALRKRRRRPETRTRFLSFFDHP